MEVKEKKKEKAEGGIRKGPTGEEIRRLYAEGRLILSALRNMSTLPATHNDWTYSKPSGDRRLPRFLSTKPRSYPDTGAWAGT